MSALTRTFLPWYRAGFSTGLSGRPAAGSARSDLDTTISLSDTALSTRLPAQLTGPGDVAGLDPVEVARVEPYDGCPDFEPSQFPYVELIHCDLPWRFTPLGPEDTDLPGGAAPVTGGRLRPWLCLAVIPTAKLTLSAAPAGALPILTADAAELPDPGEAWAWAHVQTVTAAGEDVASALGDASRSLARIVAPRRLAAATPYTACLVPTFAAGRDALAAGAPADPLADAWRPGDSAVALPVYLSWQFSTAQAGSFETLARRLRPVSAPGAMSGRQVDTADPGWGAQASPGRTTPMQGALRPAGVAEPAGDATLADSLRAAVSSDNAGVQLRPPIYGQDYARGQTTIAAGASGWLIDLNTDPRRRSAAGLAAWSVAVLQDELVNAAWQQLAQPPAQGASPELGDAVSGSLARHDAAGPAALPATFVRLARPGGPLSAAALATARPLPAAAPRGTPATSASAGATAFAPTFPQPAYTLLRSIAPEWLLPGAGDVLDDSVLLASSNPAFAEAFLVGLNHALARELAWRRYPLDGTRTMFHDFWATATADDSGVGEIADWPADSPLGGHGHSAEQLVLLMRGALFRRFPTVQVYLSQTAADGTETHLTANLSGSLGADMLFLGFPLSPAQALAAQPPWSVVIQESVHHVRFGIGDPPAAASGAALTTWQDLDWSVPQVRNGAYAPVVGPLLGATHPLAPGDATTATWGASSAHQAVILQQPAFRIRIPVSLWLADLTHPAVS